MPPLLDLETVSRAINQSDDHRDLAERFAELVDGDNDAGLWLRDSIFTGSAIGYGDARLEAKSNITTFRRSKLTALDDSEGPGVSWGPFTPDEAIEFMESRGILLPETYYGQLPAEARALGFSIAGISQVETLQVVLDDLSEALRVGTPYREWRRNILTDPLLGNLPDWRVENIFRTNIQTAYAHGRGTQQLANVRFRPYGLIRTTDDDRRRPNHGRLEGFIAHLDDPIWATVTPPLGYQCRCKRMSLTEKQAKARGITTGRDFQADEGWGSDPAKDLSHGAKSKITEMIGQVDPAFIPALVRILEGLG